MKSGEFRDRLSDLALSAGVALTATHVDQLQAYYELLCRWNRKINLTALPLEPLADATLDRLLVEPTAAARYVPESRVEWLDVGSGGGSPAIPLRIARPLTELSLIEARAKKAAFLRESVRELAWTNVSVVNDRFEDFVGREDSVRSASLVTLRAVKVSQTICSAVQIVLKPYGQLLLFGAQNVDLPASFREVERVRLLPSAASSTLLVIRRSTWNTKNR